MDSDPLPGNAEPQLGASEVNSTKLGLGAPRGGSDAYAPPRGWYSRGYLPHYNNRHTLQSVTFRLADSLPKSKLAELEQELLTMDSAKVDVTRRMKIDAWLDSGMGC